MYRLLYQRITDKEPIYLDSKDIEILKKTRLIMISGLGDISAEFLIGPTIDNIEPYIKKEIGIK